MVAPVKIGVAGGLLFLFGAVFGFWGFHKFLNYKIGEGVGLKKDSDMRKMWTKMPIPVEFKVNMFNLTNPDGVAAGEKPKVKEIGPYFFDEWKEKVLLEDNISEDTISFNMKATWIFKPERSSGLTGEEMITIPHPVLFSMVNKVEQEKPGALPMLGKAIPALFNNLTTPFVTVKVMDVLFNGIPVNCSSTEFGPKAVCTLIRANPKGLKKESEDIFTFSFFGLRNGTMDEGRFTVKRGIVDPKEVGQVVGFNGIPKLKVWSGPTCNALTGTDSTIFPPFIAPGEDVVSFAPDLCRSLGAKYQGPIVYKGIHGNRYTATLGDMSTNEDEKCYCPTPTTCLKKGAFDITKCAGAPIVLTLPHYYEADESYLEEVEGLHPEKDKHEIFLNFEPITGTPLGARKRLQFNMKSHPVPKIPLMKALPTTMIPMFWIEEGLELDQSFIDILEASLFRTMRIVGVSKWVVMALGLALVGGAVFLYLQRQKKPITPVQVEKSTRNYWVRAKRRRSKLSSIGKEKRVVNNRCIEHNPARE